MLECCLSHIIYKIKKFHFSLTQNLSSCSLFFFVDLIMNHDHDHAAMIASTTTPMNHANHIMSHQADINRVVDGHDHPKKDLMMMMMAVSISFSQN
jgi:hypothetical protein